MYLKYCSSPRAFQTQDCKRKGSRLCFQSLSVKTLPANHYTVMVWTAEAAKGTELVTSMRSRTRSLGPKGAGQGWRGGSISFWLFWLWTFHWKVLPPLDLTTQGSCMKYDNPQEVPADFWSRVSMLEMLVIIIIFATSELKFVFTYSFSKQCWAPNPEPREH